MKIVEGYIYSFDDGIHIVDRIADNVYHTINLKNGRHDIFNEYNLKTRRGFKDITNKLDEKTFNKLVKYIKDLGKYVGAINQDSECWKLGHKAICIEVKYMNRGKISIMPGLHINGKKITKVRHNGEINIIIE